MKTSNNVNYEKNKNEQRIKYVNSIKKMIYINLFIFPIAVFILFIGYLFFISSFIGTQLNIVLITFGNLFIITGVILAVISEIFSIIISIKMYIYTYEKESNKSLRLFSATYVMTIIFGYFGLILSFIWTKIEMKFLDVESPKNGFHENLEKINSNEIEKR